MPSFTIGSFAFLLLGLGACGGDDSGPATPGDSDAATGDAAPVTPGIDGSAQESAVEAAAGPACMVPDGTPNNEKGIGGSCKSSADCASEAGARLCTADFGIEPKFCTTFCGSDDQCGSTAHCAHSVQGDGCRPNSCRPPSAE